MLIPVLSRRLGKGDESAPIPLWRDPEVSIADWLIQFIIPHILPLKKATRKIKSNGGDIKPIQSVRRMLENTNKSHDKQFAAWRTIQHQVHPSAHPNNEPHRPCTVAAAPSDSVEFSLTCMGDWREFS